MSDTLVGCVFPATGIRGHRIARRDIRSSLLETDIQERGGHRPFDWYKNKHQERNNIHANYSHSRNGRIVTRVACHYASVRAITPLHRK